MNSAGGEGVEEGGGCMWVGLVGWGWVRVDGDGKHFYSPLCIWSDNTFQSFVLSSSGHLYGCGRTCHTKRPSMDICPCIFLLKRRCRKQGCRDAGVQGTKVF